MEKSKKKQLIVSIVAIVLLIVATVGVTYAFFNYTRTGLANTVSTGRIYFNSSQDGRINLTNIFPIDPTETGVMNDATKVGTVAITVTGDTTYDKGVEYLISATNVTNTVGTGNNQKTIPISISATTSGTLGTSDDNYFEDRDTATGHIYKVLAKDTISNNDQLMVGYIANNTTGINGTITIKAYIDKNKVAITDTYDGTASDDMGTTTNWVNGRTVFTTEEWNSMQGTGVSFQVKVEANEGIWVIDKDRNDMKNFYSVETFTNAQKSSITEISFVKTTEEEINSHANLIDLTAENGNGIVKGWIDNNKLYIASPGTIYFPENSIGLFSIFKNTTIIRFNDSINTSKVTDMTGMLSGVSCTDLNLSYFDTSNVTTMNGMFQNCTNLITLDLSSLDMSNVTQTAQMFGSCTNLQTIYVSNNWNVDNVTVSFGMFQNCTSLKGGGTPQTAYDSNHTDKEYARIDGGANSSTPGYLTLKTN